MKPNKTKRLIINHIIQCVSILYLTSAHAAPIVNIIDPEPTSCPKIPPIHTDPETSLRCKSHWSRSSSNGDTIATAVVGGTLATAGMGNIGATHNTDLPLRDLLDTDPPPRDVIFEPLDTAPLTRNIIIPDQPLEEATAVEEAEGLLEGITISCEIIGVGVAVIGGGSLAIYIGVKAYEAYEDWKKAKAIENWKKANTQVKYQINDSDGRPLYTGDTALEDHEEFNVKAVTQSCDLESGLQYFLTLTNTEGKTLIDRERFIAP